MQLDNIINVESPLPYLCNRLFDYGSLDPVVVTMQGLNSVGRSGEGIASEDIMKIQYEMVHMLGAV